MYGCACPLQSFGEIELNQNAASESHSHLKEHHAVVRSWDSAADVSDEADDRPHAMEESDDISTEFGKIQYINEIRDDGEDEDKDDDEEEQYDKKENENEALEGK